MVYVRLVLELFECTVYSIEAADTLNSCTMKLVTMLNFVKSVGREALEEQ